MGSPEDKLSEMGITLPDAPNPVANYLPAVRTGNLLFLSGSIPAAGDDGNIPVGKVGADMTVEEGYQAARATGLNLIARLKAELGELSRVKRVVKVLAMVNSAPDFTETPAVANGFSDLMAEVFGEAGRHARSAVGLAALPLGVPIEVEMIVEVSD